LINARHLLALTASTYPGYTQLVKTKRQIGNDNAHRSFAVKTFVTYLRVSTERQGASGLGLEAQETAVAAFVSQEGGEVIGSFVEVESGKKSDRPQLIAALALCRKKKATLLIAKIDRLARNVAFISRLMESSVPFVATDCPCANKLMVHLLAAFAEWERDQISSRTKAALAAAKARGVRLGAPDPRKGSAQGVAAIHAKADGFAARVTPTIAGIRAAGVTSLSGIAQALNARGVPTARGGEWTATAVRRVEQRAG
jgi:DNA invertase Pin-like site-specific DNA recombinase